MRKLLKTMLESLGMLESALWVREFGRRIRFLPRNLRYIGGRAPDGLPLPPLALVNLATGQPDHHWLIEGGRLAAASIRGILKRNGKEIEALTSLLDFGCGCGRVLRQWSSLGDVQVHGTDYNTDLVAWCSNNLAFATLSANSLAPPLSYSDESFDLVYALSVFTHLSEPLQFAWIEELSRVLRPGGHLLISTHGERYLAQLTPEERQLFASGQLVVKNPDLVGTNKCGAYHARMFVQEQLGMDLALVEFAPEGAAGNPYQDYYLFRKPPRDGH